MAASLNAAHFALMKHTVKTVEQLIQSIRDMMQRSESKNKLVKAYTEPNPKKRQARNRYIYDRFGPAYVERARKLAPKKETTAAR